MPFGCVHVAQASRTQSFPLVCPSVARPVTAQREEERQEKLPVAAAKRLAVKRGRYMGSLCPTGSRGIGALDTERQLQ